ncbi:hypothetical protein DFH27DRAFT_643245 [Peziza echinospora]|nr:hypothetical protein DFH27DRAFT_643245 [Peziza echinospora]
MVPLPLIRSSNALTPTHLPPRLTAVFLGATSGIGEETLYNLASGTLTLTPLIIFVGRNADAGARIEAEIRTRNPSAEVVFLRCGDLALMAETERVCGLVREAVLERRGEGGGVNLLFLSAGSFGFKKELTPEGLERHSALGTYSRILTIRLLLPLLTLASTTTSPTSPNPPTPPLSRVIMLYGGPKGSKIDPQDLPGTHKTPIAFRMISGTMLNLQLHHLSLLAPSTSFIHIYPGLVPTASQDNLPFGFRQLVKSVMWVFGRWIVVSVGESGERTWFCCSSGRYPSREGEVAGGGGVPVGLVPGLEIADGGDGVKGSGMYMLHWDGESQRSKYFDEARGDGGAEKVVAHFEEVFERIRREREEREGV